jgi:hypothetical protein
VVTYYDRAWFLFYVQDASGGVYIYPGPERLALRAGEEVEITGITDQGGFRPFIFEPKVKVIGHGSLPETTPSSPARLATGKDDCQFVEIHGVVRSVGEDTGHLDLELGVDGRRVKVIVLNLPQQGQLGLAGATISVRGVCAIQADKNRRVADFLLMVPSLAELRVEKPPPQDSFDLPVRSISSLSAGRTNGGDVSRVRIQARVTALQAGKWIEANDGSNAHLA